ncbi:hypothetical protein AM501_28505 [Aneurinibacillus migulanus]|uniref:hypothetical protein n=1 Tax=Aneurinibacillus migulanus TaxID=47500 RepID=UPI0005BE7DA0|nr:hypothetical protein [Aneurinibacillus migulanus]KIV53525.1 hypothetical protein TS64_19045 [Aneurinibacillus migulanus]KPD05032.1 hypothetical protein AM501_28505 [Aneurinibacillus migulanus]MCP1359162.1 hypothetical protein [Aneurinibacillus migulanus]MED4730188.1 hypothetical protein [Aneurinibacillus migulanus]
MKMKKTALSLIVCSLAFTPAAFAQEDKDVNQKLGVKIASQEKLNEWLKSKGVNATVAIGHIPTVDEINAALKDLKASRDNKKLSKDLGNGFKVEVEVFHTPTEVKVPTYIPRKDVAGKKLESATATGVVRIMYNDQIMYTLAANSLEFLYDGERVIDFKDAPPSTDPRTLSSTNDREEQFLYYTSPFDKDTIAKARFPWLTSEDNLIRGHIELRFNGTGNYYIKDVYFQ